ncbi:MAG: hypothetical protein JXA97_01510 [Anaerolineales bacterium]|nr:hypothetical protein [Anaerolineales bacterium]
MKPKLVISAAVSAVLFISACSQTQETPDSSPLPPLAVPVQTAQPVGSPPASPVPADCPISPDPGAVLTLEASSNLVQDVLGFLNAGGSIADTRVALRNWNNSSPEDTALAQVDFNGDGILDLVAAIRINADTPLESRVFSLACANARYQLAYISPALYGNQPADIYAVEDFTGNGLEDILTIHESCGAHTCSLQPTLLTWTDGRLSDRWTESTADIPTPLIEIINSEESLPIVRITGTSIQSAGAGPLRPFQRDFSWDAAAQAMTLLLETTLPATYRIHVLLDADEAYLRNEFELALQGYQRVIEDDGLDDWIYGNEGYSRLSAYALFRSMVLHLQRGEKSQGEAAFLVLREGYLSIGGRMFAEMGQAFWESFSNGNNLEAGCLAARAYAELHAAEILDVLSYGYANPAYTVSDICPIIP